MTGVGIVGGAGYTAGELIRVLLWHPEVKLQFVQSTSQAGKRLSDIHKDLLGSTDLHFTNEWDNNVDLIFLSMGQGQSKMFMEKHNPGEAIKIIDMSQDFRIPEENSNSFIYGLPEINRDKIKKAQRIANPGCFATAIQLALLPLAHAGRLNNDVHVTGITGSTGAGHSLQLSSHFSWRASNISVYKPLKHQHLAEINQTLQRLQKDWRHKIFFLPFRGNFTRGIFVTAYLKTELKEEENRNLFKAYYKSHPFVVISDQNPDLKQVINTNKCVLHVKTIDDSLLIISIIDNLLKGASGQAVQNMNLMFGFQETSGLSLKPSAF